MFLKTRIASFFLCFAGSLSSFASSSTDLSQEVGSQVSMKTVKDVGCETLFPNFKKTNKLTKLLINEVSCSAIPEKQGTEVGYNQNDLSALHKLALMNANGNGIEFASGSSYFASKLTINEKVTNLTCVERSELAIEEGKNIIKKYEKELDVKLQSRIGTIKGDLYNKDTFSKLKNNHYDFAVAFNLLHYASPKQARDFLSYAAGKLKSDADFYVLANAPFKAVRDIYLNEKEKGNPYSGCVLITRVETFPVSYNAKTKKIGDKPLASIKMSHTFSPLKNDHKISTTTLKLVKQELSESNGNTININTTLTHAFLFWDKDMAGRLFNDAGFTIVESLYTNGKGELSDSLEEDAISLLIHAKKK